MKTLKKQFKSVTLIVSMLILFQGCTVYKPTNVTLDEAVKSEVGVRVKTKENQTLKFKKIVFDDGQFYGIKKNKGDLIKNQINEQEVKIVQLKNRKKSSFMSIAVAVIATAGVIGAIEFVSFSNNFCMGNC